MATKGHERRKAWLINPAMQGRIVFRMTALPAAVLAGIAVFTGFYCSDVLTEARALDQELPDLMPLIWLVMAFELVAAGMLVMHALRLSHTIAGPAYRIAKSLERIRTGDFEFRVKLRKGDHLTELRDEMNLLLDWLQQHRQSLAHASQPSSPAATESQPTQPHAEARVDG
jgi:methyl-accepting chemotaxis protein